MQPDESAGPEEERWRMKTRFAVIIGVPLLTLFLGIVGQVFAADTMNDYSITPPFIQETIKPNMLFMIDNSASMYDLSYVDEGRKTCSTTLTTYCTKNSDCPGGETCSNFLREPYYCYDQTYRSGKTYIGNFDPAKLYQYSTANSQFEETATFSCTAGAGQEAKSISNTLCVIYSNTSPYAVSTFLASGNYLNWLTASKFDVEKRILTGGKYVGTQLLSESRGCVGQSYIKEANTGDFANYSSPETNNTNSSLGITFGVRGPYDPYNKSAPSPGGPDLYRYLQGKLQPGRLPGRHLSDAVWRERGYQEIRGGVSQFYLGRDPVGCREDQGRLPAEHAGLLAVTRRP